MRCGARSSAAEQVAHNHLVPGSNPGGPIEDSQDVGFLSPKVYNRYNLHYIFDRGVNKGSYANWTLSAGHDFVPYNTRLQAHPSGDRIRFVTDEGLAIIYEINPGRMGMSAGQYVDLVTSPTLVSYEGLSDVDRQGIKAGKAMVGMSKQGVMIALGYPAANRTPSPDQNNAWTYWKGRYNTYAVEFDNSGNVISIRD